MSGKKEARQDAVDVIGAGLLAAAGGLGHRRVAGEVGRPVSTVRGWLARITRGADRVLAVCAAAAWQVAGRVGVPPSFRTTDLLGSIPGKEKERASKEKSLHS